MSTVANSTHSSITGHFEELKREINSFHTVYDQWLSSRQQVVTVDKQAFQKTLEEEQGIIIVTAYLYPSFIRDGRGTEEAIRTACAEKGRHC